MSTRTEPKERKLTALVGLEKEEQLYPSLFYLAPVPGLDNPRWEDFMTSPDLLLNRKLMIVFVCEKTGRCVTYGGDPGLQFVVIKDRVKNILDFWERFGLIIKLSAAYLKTSRGGTDNVPPTLTSVARPDEDAVEVISRYANEIGIVIDTVLLAAGRHNVLTAIKPGKGVRGIEDLEKSELQRLAQESYRAFGDFLGSVGFDPTNLPMQVETDDAGDLLWAAIETPKANTPPLVPTNFTPPHQSCCMLQ